jgi:glycosyltransferase involved in cell wall biosynthesis
LWLVSIFDEYLPWTQMRLDLANTADLDHYFEPAMNVIQDQEVPITNLMVLLYAKVKKATDCSHIKHRLAIVQWYESVGKKTFRIVELEALLINKNNDTSTSLVKGGINIIGYARSMSGLGDDIRGLIKVLERLNIPHTVVCLGHVSDNIMYDNVSNEAMKPKYETSIFCMNGFEFCKICRIYTSMSDAFGYIVLQAPWELPKLVSEWTPFFGVVDQIWAISKFVAKTFIDAGFENVVYNPPIVDMLTQNSPNKSLKQKRPFTFLYIFDAASYLSRKNPNAAVSSFQQAFQLGENVRLILKVTNVDNNAEFAALEHKWASDQRIKVEKTLLKPEQITTLIGNCDCYLSLHRSEGFGRTIAQASLLGKPVISTAWSGSLDILPKDCSLGVPYTLVAVKENEYPSFEEQYWADPDPQIAADKLRQVYNATDKERLKIGFENQQFAQSCFTIDASLQHYREQFEQIIQGRMKYDIA